LIIKNGQPVEKQSGDAGAVSDDHREPDDRRGGSDAVFRGRSCIGDAHSGVHCAIIRTLSLSRHLPIDFSPAGNPAGEI